MSELQNGNIVPLVVARDGTVLNQEQSFVMYVMVAEAGTYIWVLMNGLLGVKIKLIGLLVKHIYLAQVETCERINLDIRNTNKPLKEVIFVAEPFIPLSPTFFIVPIGSTPLGGDIHESFNVDSNGNLSNGHTTIQVPGFPSFHIDHD
jgi:hypothetical protein